MQQRLRRMCPIYLSMEVLGILNTSCIWSLQLAFPGLFCRNNQQNTSVRINLNSLEFYNFKRLSHRVTWWHSLEPENDFGLLWKFLRPRPWLSTPSNELVGFQCPKIPLYLFNDPWSLPVLWWKWRYMELSRKIHETILKIHIRNLTWKYPGNRQRSGETEETQFHFLIVLPLPAAPKPERKYHWEEKNLGKSKDLKGQSGSQLVTSFQLFLTQPLPTLFGPDLHYGRRSQRP